MKRKILIVGIILIVLVGGALLISMYQYAQVEKRITKIVPGVEERVMFFNIGDGDRYYLAALMDSIGKCDPKVLAVDVFFDSLKNRHMDSVLGESIERNQVVLATRFNGVKYISSHKVFNSRAMDLGYAQGVSEGRFFRDFFPIRSYSGIEFKHFAIAIAQHYEPEKAEKFIQQKVTNNELMEVVFRKFDHQFKVYDFKDLSFDCTEIAGKIAYLGYLGPTNEDRHFTLSRYLNPKKEKGKPDMYGSAIVSNQVLMILDGDYE